ncbi:MAG: hypothetical protein EOO45_08495 [Flavobacterium sp.]|nr:MAG: hypothetical protein EOO45_08495 [Flavobacterium sp.]
MRAAGNIITSTLKAVPILLLLALQSCGTYNSKTADIENDIFNGDFKKAIAGIEKNKFLLKDRNRLLYLLEKGKIEHLSGNYEASNALFEEAYILVDDRIKTGAGQAVAAKFTNPMAEPYKGEDFEKVTIHYYKALNYFQLGMPNEALVEAKRINLKLYALNEKYKDNKNKYGEDAFSQILQGILYESTGDINNAFIAYRNAEEIYTKNGGAYFGVAMPQQLKEDLLRTTRQLGFREEHEAYLKKFKPEEAKNKIKKGSTVPPVPPPPPTGEAIVFWENGLAPAKDQVVVTASGKFGAFVGTYNDGEVAEEILIPIPPGVDIGVINAIAIPRYRTRPSYYGKATILVEGREQQLELAQDFNTIARQSLKDRMLRETIDLVVRFATKKAASAGLGAIGKELFGDAGGELVKMGADIAGAATEKADTRNWQTLPATIGYTRVPLREGENKFIIKKYGPQGIDTDTLYIPYKRGLQIVNYFDLGRTQTLSDISSTEVKNNEGNSANAVQSPVSFKYKPAEAGVSTKTVVDRYVSEIGGAEKVNSISTFYSRTVAKNTYPGGTSTIETITKNNSKGDQYIRTTADGVLVNTMAVNNKGGYSIGKDGKKIVMDNETYATIRKNTSFHNSLVLPSTENNAVLKGITILNGEDVYAISFKPAMGGNETINFYSLKSGLLMASGSEVAGRNGTTQSLVYISDYRDVKGVKFPFRTTISLPNISVETITSEIKINEGVSDSDFN